MVIGLTGVHFSSEIIHVISNRTDRTKLHSTQFNYHYLEFVGPAIMNNCDDPGREGKYLYGLYEEEVRFRPKGKSFFRHQVCDRVGNH